MLPAVTRCRLMLHDACHCQPLPDAACVHGAWLQEEASIRILTRRPILPSEEEQAANARSRSAKLRVVEKL